MRKIYLLRTLFLLVAMPLCAGIITLPDNAHYSYSGDTSLTGDTFNRPIANGDLPPNSLSLDADAVGYDAFSFQVTTPGVYSFLITPVGFAFSSYLFLYETAFVPAAPLTDVLLGESNGDTTSSFAATLFANTVYIAVATGFSNFDEGAYTGVITEIAPLAPEPSTFALISAIMLFPAVACVLRVTGRRRDPADRTLAT
jgi:hypothetical protein